MYTSYFEPFSLPEDQSISVFDDESLDISDASSPHGSLFTATPISTSSLGPEFVSDLDRALKAIGKALAVGPLLQLNPDTLSLLQATQNSLQEVCMRVTAEAEVPSLSAGSSPMDDEFREAEQRVQNLTFPDYSAVLRPKTIGTITDVKKEVKQVGQAQTSVKKDESAGMTFTTLTFGADGSGVTTTPIVDDSMGPPKSRKGSKRHAKAPYVDHLKAWRSQPYGPRQLAKRPDDLMMEFVLDPTTTTHESHAPFESAEFFITPPSAHQYNRQLN